MRLIHGRHVHALDSLDLSPSWLIFFNFLRSYNGRRRRMNVADENICGGILHKESRKMKMVRRTVDFFLC